jgi:hypothetical protein
MTLAEGLPAVVSGMVVPGDAQAVNYSNVSARAANSEAFFGFESGGPVRPDGTFRLQLTPGEYILEARGFTRTQPGETPRQENELVGTTRVTVGTGGADSVTILLGRGATATGRVVFEGKTPPPTPPPTFNVPLYSQGGPGCRPARATIAPDWTFKVEGLTGTCGSPPGGNFGRFLLKAVNVRGQNLVDRTLTFESGQNYSDVTIVVTDQRTQIDFTATDESGQPTHEYAVLLFPADKDRWTQLQRYVRTSAPAPPAALEAQRRAIEGRGQIPPGALQQMSRIKQGMVRMTSLPPGDYYAIAVDDMDPEDTLDPAILDKLIPSATRVTLSDDGPAEITLRRFEFRDIIR